MAEQDHSNGFTIRDPLTDGFLNGFGVRTSPSVAVRWLLAAPSCGAAVIHHAMIPQHAAESLVVGLAFALAGWFQLAFGVAMLLRPRCGGFGPPSSPTRASLRRGRPVGRSAWPSWTGAGGKARALSADLLCVAFEVLIIVAACSLLLVPALLGWWGRLAVYLVTFVLIGILVATTVVLALPSTADHGHSGVELTSEAVHAHTEADPTDLVGDAPSASGSTVHHHDPTR